jgi:prevent-host-death family protein
MKEVNIHEAKTHLSRILAWVATGEEVIVAKAGKPIARIVPVSKPRKKRIPGQDKGLVTIARDFDAPLPEKILAGFEA